MNELEKESLSILNFPGTSLAFNPARRTRYAKRDSVILFSF
jgi:hypothetical protein